MKHRNYICFWKPWDPDGYLSQWYNHDMIEGGITFKNCEQYMMYHKALTFHDTKIAEQILRENNPAIMKKLGRKVRNFDGTVWDSVKHDIVLRGNLLKFSDPELRKQLLDTGDCILMEVSPFDSVWGTGKNAFESIRDYPYCGENLLGKILMEVRRYYVNT